MGTDDGGEMAIDPKRVFGPCFKKLVIRKMSMAAIPDGGGLADGMKFILNPSAMREGWINAQEWCEAAIAAVRSAPDPNPFKTASEEEISAEILRRAQK